MEEKRENLKSSKQKKLLERLVGELSREHLDLYYRPTVDIAHTLKRYISKEASLTNDEEDLLAPLSEYDIQVLLSLNSQA